MFPAEEYENIYSLVFELVMTGQNIEDVMQIPYTEFQLLATHLSEKASKMSGKPHFSYQKSSHKEMIRKAKEIEAKGKKE